MLKRPNCFGLLYNNLKSCHIRFMCKNVKGSKKILNYFTKNDQESALKLFPTCLKRITSKKNQILYIADQNAANAIADKIAHYRIKDVPFIEVNPGPYILTHELVCKMNLKEICLIQKKEDFLYSQERKDEIEKMNVLLRQVNYDWLYFGSATDLIHQLCEKRQWNDDIVCQLYINSLSQDIDRIIGGVLKQENLFTNGRIEIFTTIPAIEFMKLTAHSKSTYWLYTYKSCIFQILFEYDVLGDIKKESFLPWYNPKPAFGGKIDCNMDTFYLVRIIPRRDLFSLWKPEDLPLLRFFIHQLFFKRSGHIIPKLEQWIPGIGVDLITTTFNKQTSINEISDESILGNLNNAFHAFTKCGSLTPLQMCALFRFFQNSSQYTSSCFHQQFKKFITARNANRQSIS